LTWDSWPKTRHGFSGGRLDGDLSTCGQVGHPESIEADIAKVARAEEKEDAGDDAPMEED